MTCFSLRERLMDILETNSGICVHYGGPPAEDLMRKHGVLGRILLISQEWIGRLRAKIYEQLDTLVESKRVIRSLC